MEVDTAGETPNGQSFECGQEARLRLNVYTDLAEAAVVDCARSSRRVPLCQRWRKQDVKIQHGVAYWNSGIRTEFR